MFFLDFPKGSTKGTLKKFRRPSGGISYTIAVLLNRAAKILINIERYFVKDNFSKGRYFDKINQGYKFWNPKSQNYFINKLPVWSF